ncbi:MAG TPA: hypothetical protein VIM06_02100 [Rhodanobacter sp.]
MRAYLLSIMLLIAAGVAGCNDTSSDTVITYISTQTSDGSIAIHAHGRADANITAAGDLNIAGTKVTVTSEQRDLLKQYYITALMMRDHGIATGKAGMATAGKALSSVASGLASGNTDKIDSEVNASTANVEAHAALICNDLADLRSTQEKLLASQLPAFQPYALIKANEADDCRGRKIYRE